MLNNETWLFHENLFKEYWVVEKKSWARDLGWIEELRNSKVSGWGVIGAQELSVMDYINIVDLDDADKKLYKYVDGKWEHISGPVIFSVKKDDDQTFIVGWAGDPKVIERLKKKTANPWDWKGITIIDINPTIALPISKKAKRLLPVFFVSNGEKNADANWQRVQELCPRAVRIDGIWGRRNVFMKCAELSEDTHFIKVTGKNYITDPSVFDFLPDETNADSHILFYAHNASNNLEYSHMGVVCYNKELVLNTPESFGLDFTNFSKNTVIPRCVSVATFATSPYEAWRTAFRESVKLSLNTSNEAKDWLTTWTRFAQGPNCDWVILGAYQGHKFAQENKTNLSLLEKTVDWKWLEQYFKDNSQMNENVQLVTI